MRRRALHQVRHKEWTMKDLSISEWTRHNRVAYTSAADLSAALHFRDFIIIIMLAF
jgi:hypothetical protein